MALALRSNERSLSPEQEALRDETLRGFAAWPKAMSPKFFYDHRGSQLFELICQQPEYYPTRTEETILRLAAQDIAALAGRNASLVELGSGASRKIRLLLEALRPARYLGIDISREFLQASTRRLASDYRWLDVHALCADFSQPLKLPGDALDNARWPSSRAPASATSTRTRRAPSCAICTRRCRPAVVC